MIIIICSLNITNLLYADGAPMLPKDGSTVIPVYDTDIILEHETINIYLRRREFYVEVDYLFVNTGQAKSIVIGFPNGWKEDVEDYPIEDFRAYESGSELSIYRKYTSISDDNSDFHEYYYECFDVQFDALESKSIKNTYSSVYGYNYDLTEFYMNYILTTGSLWHDSISNVRVNIYIEGISAQELKRRWIGNWWDDDFDEEYLQGISFSPEAEKINDLLYHMEFEDIEPDFNIRITIQRLIYRRAEASSELTSTGNSYDYAADNIYDNNPATSWVESAPGNGIGEYVELFLTYGNKAWYDLHKIDKIGIINGFAENEQLFYSNNRVKTIRLEFDSYQYVNSQLDDSVYQSIINESIIIELEDTMEMQYYFFDEPIIAKSIKIIIEDVYAGSKWDDTCIAEFQVFPKSE